MQIVYMILAAFAILAGIILLYVVFSVLSLWLTGMLAGVPVKMSKLISMRVRGMPCRNILSARVMAGAAGIDIGIDRLEKHYLSGGDPINAVRILLKSGSEGSSATWENACEADLAQQDEDR